MCDVHVHVVLCVVLVLCVLACVWHGLMRGKPLPRAEVQHASVCTFKTPPCVPAKRPHVEHMRAFCRYTRRRFECTHESVLNLSTGVFSLLSSSLVPSSFSLTPLLLLSSFPSLSSSSFVLLLRSLPSFSLSLSLSIHLFLSLSLFSLSLYLPLSSLFSSLLFPHANKHCIKH